MKNNTPKLRFKEFTDEWQEKKLSDVANSISSGKSIAKSELDGEFSIFGSTGQIGTSRIFDYEGDKLLVARVGANAGTTYRVTGRYSVSDNTLMLDFKRSLDINFAYDLIGKSNIKKLVFGSGQPLVTGGHLKALKIIVPQVEEQEKIAGFLGAVDEKITKLEEKKKGFEKYKKGVMQAIFSSCHPELDSGSRIRFRKPDGSNYPDWEEKKLGEVLKIGSGRDYKHLKTGNIPVFGTGGYMLSVNKCLHSGETVFIGRKGTIDKPFYYKGVFWTVDTLFYTYSFDGIGPKFTSYVFELINWQKHNEASGVPSLSKTTIEKIKVNLPSLPEQEKIAELLTSLDKKVELINKESEQAKLFKKSLLQQMFV